MLEAFFFLPCYFLLQVRLGRMLISGPELREFDPLAEPAKA